MASIHRNIIIARLRIRRVIDEVTGRANQFSMLLLQNFPIKHSEGLVMYSMDLCSYREGGRTNNGGQERNSGDVRGILKRKWRCSLTGLPVAHTLNPLAACQYDSRLQILSKRYTPWSASIAPPWIYEMVGISAILHHASQSIRYTQLSRLFQYDTVTTPRHWGHVLCHSKVFSEFQ